MNIRAFVCAGSVAMALSSFSIECGAIELPNRPLTSEESALQQAGSISDPGEREEALRLALETGLLGPREEIQFLIFDYIVENSRWLDLSPYEDVFREFDSIQDRHVSMWLLDMNKLRRMSHERRLDIYSRAIIDGVVFLEHGQKLTRILAIKSALLDGYIELRDVIDLYYPDLDPYYKTLVTADALLINYEFKTSGSNREAAAKIFADNMLEYDQVEFRSRLGHDRNFRRIFQETAKFVCEMNPYTGAINPGCTSIAKIFLRERAYRREANRAAVSKGVERETTVAPPFTDDWLDWMATLDLGEKSFIEIDTRDTLRDRDSVQ